MPRCLISELPSAKSYVSWCDATLEHAVIAETKGVAGKLTAAREALSCACSFPLLWTRAASSNSLLLSFPLPALPFSAPREAHLKA